MCSCYNPAMPYRTTSFCSGETYHLYNRGNNYQHVFFEGENYIFFLRLLKKVAIPDSFEIIAYCLMPNHYHLLVSLKTNDLSRVMQRLILAYTNAINKRYHRVGALFQGRFKGIHVSQDDHLLHLSRYIHLNPVAAGLVEKADDWVYSSYLDYLGLRDGNLLNPSMILAQFGTSVEYRRFVEDTIENDQKVINHLILEKSPLS
jgi:putative transposase